MSYFDRNKQSPQIDAIADSLYQDLLQQWSAAKDAVEGWSAKPAAERAGTAKNQGQSASEWLAATADLSGRLSVIWLKTSWLITRHMADAAYAGLRRDRKRS